MRLTKTLFTTNYNRESKSFIGVGYKMLDPLGLMKSQKLQPKSDTAEQCKYFNLEFKDNPTWKKAAFSFVTNGTPKPSNLESTVNGDSYPPGFHIFLNMQDAERYDSGVLVEVQYKDVLCFGTQNTGGIFTKKTYDAPCIIARQMKLIRPLKFVD